ncbi:ATP-binding protein [Desulfoplanes sp. PS50]
MRMQSLSFCKEINDPQEKKRLEMIHDRIRQKIADYRHYHFTREQIHALAIFFDLAQEFNSLEDLYSLAVSTPKELFGIDASLYVLNAEGEFLVKSSTIGDQCVPEVWQEPEPFSWTPWQQGNRFILPIRCKHMLTAQLPFVPKNKDIIGILELVTPRPLTDHERFFFGKYANRVGFQTHNKILSSSNQEHLRFIKSLVQDIGHNVIVPNMYFKLLFNRFKEHLDELKKRLQNLTAELESSTQEIAPRHLDTALGGLKKSAQLLTERYRDMYSHYTRTSLFLETLLRRSHFEKGRYVLLKQACNFKKKIIDPQLEHFHPQFEEKDITVDTQLGGVPDEDTTLVADIGLLSQVFANLFSNAAKYTREVIGPDGKSHKFVSYGWEKLPDYFGPGKDAIKPNVFSTGPHIPEEERSWLFESSFRCKATRNEPGSGHGLFFVKQIVELHGGTAGYEPTEMGNNFYIILPCAD